MTLSRKLLKKFDATIHIYNARKHCGIHRNYSYSSEFGVTGIINEFRFIWLIIGMFTFWAWISPLFYIKLLMQFQYLETIVILSYM